MANGNLVTGGGGCGMDEVHVTIESDSVGASDDVEVERHGLRGLKAGLDDGAEAFLLVFVIETRIKTGFLGVEVFVGFEKLDIVLISHGKGDVLGSFFKD